MQRKLAGPQLELGLHWDKQHHKQPAMKWYYVRLQLLFRQEHASSCETPSKAHNQGRKHGKLQGEMLIPEKGREWCSAAENWVQLY